jgi:hypothetical protein
MRGSQEWPNRRQGLLSSLGSALSGLIYAPEVLAIQYIPWSCKKLSWPGWALAVRTLYMPSMATAGPALVYGPDEIPASPTASLAFLKHGLLSLGCPHEDPSKRRPTRPGDMAALPLNIRDVKNETQVIDTQKASSDTAGYKYWKACPPVDFLLTPHSQLIIPQSILWTRLNPTTFKASDPYLLYHAQRAVTLLTQATLLRRLETQS